MGLANLNSGDREGSRLKQKAKLCLAALFPVVLVVFNPQAETAVLSAIES